MGRKRDVVYICEEPHCKKRILAPNRGEFLRKKHRDMNNNYCDKMLARSDLSPTMRAEELEARYHKARFLTGNMDHPRYRPGALKDEPLLGLTKRIREGKIRTTKRG